MQKIEKENITAPKVAQELDMELSFAPNDWDNDADEPMDSNRSADDLDELMGDDSNKSEQKKDKKNNKNSDTPMLDKYGTSLTKMAKEGRLDPVFGREKELLRVAQILGRKKKNNPLLIGEPGVGKTAIVEALAQRIANNDVPITLLGKELVAVDMGSVVAGSMYRGQFEERMKAMLEELKAYPNIILYIDEIHTLMGSGNVQGGLMQPIYLSLHWLGARYVA